MSSHFGKDLCEQFVALEFLSLGEDPHVKVRKEVTKNLPLAGKMVSANFFKQRLLPFFIKLYWISYYSYFNKLRLCKDPSQDVRLTCVESIVEISKLSDSDSRQAVLTDRYLDFLKDNLKVIKVTAYKLLGFFIATLQNLKVNDRLFDSYLHMPDYLINSLMKDNEVIIHIYSKYQKLDYACLCL